MKTWVALAIAGATGVALFFIEKRVAAPVGVPKPYVPPKNPETGPILPQLAPLYKPAVWAATHLLNPTTKILRQVVTDPLNDAVGFSAPTVTVNPDGTITRTAHGPGLQDAPGVIVDSVSGAAGSIVHTVGDWL